MCLAGNICDTLGKKQIQICIYTYIYIYNNRTENIMEPCWVGL